MTLILVNNTVKHQAERVLNENREIASRVLHDFIDSRSRQLRAGMIAVVDAPEFKAVIITQDMDQATLLNSLQDAQKIMQVDLLLVVDRAGKVKIRTDLVGSSDEDLSQTPQIRDGLGGKEELFIFSEGEHVYLAFAYPIRLGTSVDGCAVGALEIGNSMALHLKEILRKEVTLWLDTRILGSTFGEKAQIQSNLDNISILKARTVSRQIRVGSQSYLAYAVFDSDYPEITLLAFAPIREILGFYYEMKFLLVSLGCLVLLITIFVGNILVARGLVKPLNLMASHFQDIAQGQGDLTCRVQVLRKDELGRLGQWFNEFITRIQGAIKTISEHSQTLADSSRQQFGINKRMSQYAETSSDQSNVVSDTAQQVSEGIQSIAACVEEMSASIKEISKNASISASVASEAVEISTDAGVSIEKLRSSGSEIDDVMKLITNITEQTNLLALNATIEAARAGEMGKGFAVVANEVKNLAKETSKATGGVRQKVNAIKEDTQAVVNLLEQLTIRIRKIYDTQSAIASSVEEQTTAASEISRHISGSAEKSVEIAKVISEVAQTAKSTLEEAKSSELTSRALAKLASDLRSLVGQFKY